MLDIMNFVSENMVIVVVVLYIIGMFLKKTPYMQDWLIPYILLVIGVVFGLFIVGGVSGILQGILCTGASVLINQLIKQGAEGINTFKQD